MWFSTLSWGCIPELYPDCMRMTNSSGTSLGIVVGALIGAIVSWWIFNRQKKTSDMLDYTLNRIEQL
jgi:Na+/glutamate symporter